MDRPRVSAPAGLTGWRARAPSSRPPRLGAVGCGATPRIRSWEQHVITEPPTDVPMRWERWINWRAGDPRWAVATIDTSDPR